MQYFKENPDYTNPKFNTKFGVYSEGCGLNNVFMSFGHDDYMYLVSLVFFPHFYIKYFPWFLLINEIVVLDNIGG